MVTCYGEPVPQGRPKISTIHGYPQAIDPAKSRSFKNYVKMESVKIMAGKPPLTDPLVVSVRVFRSCPKTFSKKKLHEVESGTLRPTTRPDLDNYIKSVVDGMTEVIWKDDSQIVAYHYTGKFYTTTQPPRVEVRVWALDELTKTKGAES
jgi:Holliday junction resolvase RusA-like endonuclease